MPYIKKEDRIKYDTVLNNMPEISNKGDLEYCVFKLMRRYMEDKDHRYSILHDCVYAVMHSSEEYRRRYLDIREDHAIKANGDI